MNGAEVEKILTYFILSLDIRPMQDIPVEIPKLLQNCIFYLNPTL